MQDRATGQGRRFLVGSLRVRFRSEDPAVMDRLVELHRGFRELDSADANDIDGEVSIDRVVRDGRAGFEAIVFGSSVGWAEDCASVELQLTRRLNRLVLDAETDVLHLHAGAVERDGVVVLVVGPSGAGKSTLVAALVHAGWRLLSDEQLGVMPDGRLVPFPRSITLRRESWPLFPELALQVGSDPASHGDLGGRGDLGNRGDLARVEVPIAQLGQSYSGEPVRPDLIVRPAVDHDAPTVVAMSQSATLATLFVDTLDLERAGMAGVDALIALVAAAPGQRIEGRDLDQTCRTVTELSADPRRPGSPVDRSAAADGEADPRTPGAIGWLFADGSAALYEPAAGTLVEVDEAGFAAWRLLGLPGAEQPAELAGSTFVDQLRSVGLVAGAAGPAASISESSSRDSRG